MMRRLLLMALLLPAMVQAQNMASADVTLPAGAKRDREAPASVSDHFFPD
ncbi:MAG: hypothetical protein WBN65_07065 [Gammaproteobacteria bacterium]